MIPPAIMIAGITHFVPSLPTTKSAMELAAPDNSTIFPNIAPKTNTKKLFTT